MHLGPIEQIILSNDNHQLITKSRDSVFVWRISGRQQEDAHVEDSFALRGSNYDDTSRAKDHLEMSQRSSTSQFVNRHCDDWAQYRKERGRMHQHISDLRRFQAPVVKQDVQFFKKEITFHSTKLMRSAPRFAFKYHCSYGLDTT